VAAPTRAAPPPLPKSTAPPPPPRPQRAAAVPAPRKSGSGAGLLLGLGAAGFLLVALAAGAGWYLFLRKPATVADAVTTEATLAPATVPPATQPTVPSLAPTVAPPVASETTPVQKSPDARSAAPPPARPTRATAETAPQAKPPIAPPVNEEPSYPTDDAAPLDGRAAGEGVAQKYRTAPGYGSGGSSTFGAGGNLRRRERTPTQLAPGERPAVNTLRLIVNAEEAFHNKHRRYGTLAELATAQVLFLDVPPQGGVVLRPGYRITLELANDGFRALATPLAGGRFFVGDDSGIIRPGTE